MCDIALALFICSSIAAAAFAVATSTVVNMTNTASSEQRIFSTTIIMLATAQSADVIRLYIRTCRRCTSIDIRVRSPHVSPGTLSHIIVLCGPGSRCLEHVVKLGARLDEVTSVVSVYSEHCALLRRHVQAEAVFSGFMQFQMEIHWLDMHTAAWCTIVSVPSHTADSPMLQACVHIPKNLLRLASQSMAVH